MHVWIIARSKIHVVEVCGTWDDVRKYYHAREVVGIKDAEVVSPWGNLNFNAVGVAMVDWKLQE